MWQTLVVELAKLAITKGPTMYAEIQRMMAGDPSAPKIEDVDKRIEILTKNPEDYFGPRRVEDIEGGPV